MKKEIFNIFSNKKEITPEIKHKIIVDYREKNSLVIAKLIKLDFEIEYRELKIADYIIRDIAVERKTVSDFISSMINKRLLNQIEELKQYENKLLLIEGIEEQELYSENDFDSRINPNAIRGFLLSIVLKHKIPLIFTKNAEDTAKYLLTISKKQDKEISLINKKKSKNEKEQIQFIIEGFPGIGPKTSKKLLEEFGSIKNLINAPEEKLKQIIGKKADVFLNLINKKSQIPKKDELFEEKGWNSSDSRCN